MEKFEQAIIIIGGYALLHTYEFLKKSTTILPTNTRVIFYIDSYYAEKSHSTYKDFEIGQYLEEFPEASQERMLKVAEGKLEKGGRITLGLLKAWIEDLQKELKELKEDQQLFAYICDNYTTVSSEGQITITGFDKAKTELFKKTHFLGGEIHLITSRTVNRTPEVKSLSKFKYHTSHFFTKLPNPKDEFHNLPYLIVGQGASGLMIFEYLSALKLDVVFPTLDYDELEANVTHRTKKAVEKILSGKAAKKYELPKRNFIFRVKDLKGNTDAKFKPLKDMMENELKKRGLIKNEKHEELAVIFSFKNSFGVEFRRVVLAVGSNSKIEEKLLENKNYYEGSVDLSEIAGAFAASNVRGSVIHQVSEIVRRIQKIVRHSYQYPVPFETTGKQDLIIYPSLFLAREDLIKLESKAIDGECRYIDYEFWREAERQLQKVSDENGKVKPDLLPSIFKKAYERRLAKQRVPIDSIKSHFDNLYRLLPFLREAEQTKEKRKRGGIPENEWIIG